MLIHTPYVYSVEVAQGFLWWRACNLWQLSRFLAPIVVHGQWQGVDKGTYSCPWTVTRRGQGYIYMFMCPETMQFKQIGANVDAKHGLVDQGGAFGMEMA